MTETRSKSILENIINLTDKQLLEILDQLSDEQLKRIRKTCREIKYSRKNNESKEINPSLPIQYTSTQSIFFTPVKKIDKKEEQRNAHRLVTHIRNADYSSMQKMLVDDPAIIFFPLKDDNYNNFSPLQVTFELYDTYAWKMFYDEIKGNLECKELFLKQAREQVSHINLTELFYGYPQYEKLYSEWQKCSEQDKKCQSLDTCGKLTQARIRLDKFFEQLFELQKKVPMHMRKELCRPEEWKNLTFDTEKLSRPEGGVIEGENKLGNSLSKYKKFLYRGSSKECYELDTYHQYYPSWETLKVDLESFKRLFETRKKELTKQINLLTFPEQINPARKRNA